MTRSRLFFWCGLAGLSAGTGYAVLSPPGTQLATWIATAAVGLVFFAGAEFRLTSRRVGESGERMLSLGIIEIIAYTLGIIFVTSITYAYFFAPSLGDPAEDRVIFIWLVTGFFSGFVLLYVLGSAPQVIWSDTEIKFKWFWLEKIILAENIEWVEYTNNNLANAIISRDGTRISFVPYRGGVSELTSYAKEHVRRNYERWNASDSV